MVLFEVVWFGVSVYWFELSDVVIVFVFCLLVVSCVERDVSLCCEMFVVLSRCLRIMKWL